MNQANELQSYIARKHPGDEVVLSVFRDGKTSDRRVTLRSRKEDAQVVSAKEEKPRDVESESGSSKELVLDAVVKHGG